MININMDKARNIHRDKIRQARTKMFETADLAFMKAIERNDDLAKATATGVKQLLRDAPANPAIDSASTPDELKAVWNESLLGESPYGGTN